jgi:hypothetical protein
MAFCVSKTNLFALVVLFGCGGPEFTNVHHSTGGAAASAGAASLVNVGGRATSAGAPSAGTTATAASSGQSTLGAGGTTGANLAGTGSTSSAGLPGSNVGLGGIGGALMTDSGTAGVPGGTGPGNAGGAPGFAGLGGLGGRSAAGTTGGAGETIGGCNHQLLANADFEAGPGSPWQEASDWPGIEIIVPSSDPNLQSESVTPYAGNYLGWLGGIPDNPYDHYEVTLSQTISIPATAAQLTLSGEYLIHSQDGQDGMYDVAYLQLNVGDDVAWLGQSFSNLDLARNWKSFTAQTTDLDDLRGKTVTFIAYSRTDLDGKTSFWLDNLRLEATCGR